MKSQVSIVFVAIALLEVIAFPVERRSLTGVRGPGYACGLGAGWCSRSDRAGDGRPDTL